MKILVVSPTFLPVIGGAELVILEVFRRLAERHEVRLVTISLKKELGVYFSDEYDNKINFEVRRFEDKVSLAKLHGHRLSCGFIPPFSLSAVAAVKNNIKEFKPDVINLHYVIPTGLAALVGKLSCGVPLVVTYNGRDVPGPGNPFFWKYWNKLAGILADETTFVSDFCRKAVFGRRSSRGVVTYNGVNIPGMPLSDRIHEKRQLGIKKEQKMIFSLGRLDKIKSVDILIKAMALLREKHPELVLYIAGQGPERSRLEGLIEELELKDRVRLLGYVPSSELGSYFAA
ncbi:MAG: glycosyltransferase family 4 protein, partial [Candidatus Omnitrophota bacterium]